MTLGDKDSGTGLDIVPESHGMDVPSACTIVIIAGKIWQLFQYGDALKYFLYLGKYLAKVDRVMTQVDRITEDIAHMPVAAFIFRDKKSDEVHYSTDIRYLVQNQFKNRNKLY